MEQTAPRRLRTLKDVPVDGRRVLVRVDFNVSVGEDGVVDSTEDYRLEATLPTLQELMQRRCKIIILTHRGEPRQNQADSSLEPIRARLADLLHEEVRATRTYFGAEVDAVLTAQEPGSCLMLPNVRLDDREETGNQKFAEGLASAADVYVNEAFSVSHRPHTSVAFVPHLLPSCAGRRTELEVRVLEKLRTSPARPYVAIVSGAKISTKVGMLHDLLRRVDRLCLGGQLANVFLAAAGQYPADHFLADDVEAAKHLKGVGGDKLLLPVDVVVGDEAGNHVAAVAVGAIPADVKCLGDIGPRTVAQFVAQAAAAKTVMWNGPVGKFEVMAYRQGTDTLAQQLAALPAWRVAGGGDTVISLERQHLVNKFDHVSVGGGAMIAYLEGKRLPGLEPLYE